VGPALRDGTLRAVDGTVVNADGTALAPGALLVSMQPHHLLGRPFHLAAPLHVIAGLRDELAPAAATRRFIESAQGAPCTGEIIPDGDHGIAKLDSPLAMLRYRDWLRAALAGATPANEPAGPGSAR